MSITPSILTSGLSLFDLAGSSTGNSSQLTVSGGQLYLSGALVSAGGGGAAGVSSLNGITGVITLVGSGGYTVVTTSGTTLFISDTGAAGLLTSINSLSGWAASAVNLGTTGSNLLNAIQTTSGNANGFYNYLTGASGQFNTNFATQVNLTLTGQALINDMAGLSGVYNSSFAPFPVYTGSFVITGTNYRYEWTGAAGSTGVATLPGVGYGSGMEFTIKNESSGAYLLLSGVVDYTNNLVLNPLGSIWLCSDNARWVSISNDPNPQPGSLTLTGAAAVLNWQAGLSYVWTLTANATGYHTGSFDGGICNVAVTNPSTYTLTWTGNATPIKWGGGSLPTQTTGNHTDVYTFASFLGTMYGSAVQNF